MADDNYADIMDWHSPIPASDLDEARADRAGTMARLFPQTNWGDQETNMAAWQPQPGGGAPEALPRASAPAATATPPWQDQAVDAWQQQQGGNVPAQQLAAATPPAAPASAPSAPATPAATPTAPAVPASVTTSGAATGTPSWADLQRKNVAAGMASLDRGDQSLQSMQSQPDLASQTADMEARRNQDAAPLNPQDQKYKPSIGQRILRGVEGSLRGGVITPMGILGALDPSALGGTAYGAPNKQYGIDSQQQTAKVAVDDQQLQNAAANWKAASDRAKAVAAEQRSNADARGRLSTELTGQQNAETSAAKIPIEQQNANTTAEEAYNNSPEGKAEAAKDLTAQTLSSRQAQIGDPKNPLSRASRADQAYFVATGKLPDPDRYHAPAEQVLFQQAHTAWVKSHPGQQPGLDDIRDMVEASKGTDKGQNMLVPDGKGGMVMTTVRSGDNVPQGATTVAGMMANGKQDAKETKAAQEVVDDAQTAHTLAHEAENGNAPADVDLALQFFKTMKGSGGAGIRFTQAEQNLIMGARNSAGDLTAVAQKVIGSGQKFTTDQRNKILKVIDIHAEAAKKHLGGSGGSTPSDNNTPPPGAKVRDYTNLGGS